MSKALAGGQSSTHSLDESLNKLNLRSQTTFQPRVAAPPIDSAGVVDVHTILGSVESCWIIPMSYCVWRTRYESLAHNSNIDQYPNPDHDWHLESQYPLLEDAILTCVSVGETSTPIMHSGR